MKKTKELKIMHEQLDLSGSPIKVKWCDYDHFTYPWHFHSEYEIVYVLQSTGMRFAGNSIEAFSEGDLVLHGSFLPHMYRNDDIYYDRIPNLRVYAIVVQFSSDFFHHAVHHYPEFYAIRELLTRSSAGIYFEKKEGMNARIRKLMEQLLKLKGLERLLTFIRILSLMSRSPDIRLLDDSHAAEQIYARHDDKIAKALAFITKNGYQTIRLVDIAEHSGMNPSAFCRYFKEKTGKTFVRYITELRINYACRLLLEGKFTVSQICFECGFNNLSNFNKHFKKIHRYTPSDYVKEFGHAPE
ncbi:MAG: AraC family transcriptional regulator [Bacteroidales bacterium]|jgi:AraC-like DNA-binding protein|nr:AraC family transcriptional regulator [Bacteroidales bacterium]